MDKYEVMKAALEQCIELFDKALPKFNWGASFLDAEAIRLLNETPGKARAALGEARRQHAFDTLPDDFEAPH